MKAWGCLQEEMQAQGQMMFLLHLLCQLGICVVGVCMWRLNQRSVQGWTQKLVLLVPRHRPVCTASCLKELKK
jgi:hypothetical protein